MAFTQEAFRVRKDDGSETTASWYAATDTNCYVPLDTIFRMRLVISSDATANNQVFYYEYRVNAGSWTDILSTGACHGAESTNVTHGADCTQQISSGSFVSNNNGIGNLVDGAVTGGLGNSFGAGDKEEVELTLIFDSAVAQNGDEIEIRVWDAGTYTSTPLITVGSEPVVTTTNAIFMGGD